MSCFIIFFIVFSLIHTFHIYFYLFSGWFIFLVSLLSSIRLTLRFSIRLSILFVKVKILYFIHFLLFKCLLSHTSSWVFFNWSKIWVLSFFYWASCCCSRFIHSLRSITRLTFIIRFLFFFRFRTLLVRNLSFLLFSSLSFFFLFTSLVFLSSYRQSLHSCWHLY